MASIGTLLAKLRQPSSSADSDRMLLARFATTGDEVAFATLVHRHGPLILGVCRRTIRDAHLAEDAFQAVFLVLARKASRVSVRESLANWLYVVARRIAVKAARRRPAVVPVQDVAGEPSEWSDLRGVLDEELERLPAKYRSPLIACYLQDRTQDETATRLGWSLSTVRRRLDAGRELLRNRLTARGVALGVVAAAAVPPAVAGELVATALGVHAGAAVSPHLLPLVNEGLRMSSQFWKVGLSLVGVAAAVAAGVAVSLGEEKPKEPAAAPTAKWSTIKGRVVWPGAAPKAVAINVTADKEHCLGKGALESDEIVVNAKSGGFKNVWVYLRPDDDDKNAKFKADEIHPALMKPKAKEHEVDQPCCQFVPRILAVREGDSINFKNSSPIPHNVKFSSDGLEFNQTLAAGGGFKSGEIKAQRNPIPFACNIHPWMMGKAMVFDHPYYAVTDADGKFEIKNAPVGKYRIVYRSETVFHKGKDGNLGFPIEIKAATTELDPLKFEVPPKTH